MDEMELDVDQIGDFENERARNIMQNYEFMKACGLPVKNPALNKKKVEKIEVEDRFAYLSDEDHSDDNKDDEDWSPSKEISTWSGGDFLLIYCTYKVYKVPDTG
uniref:Uncharacterized protein n=1 Tax=Clytia hemisphaerica TaxID=252671 RepID=A0A7M5WQK4_9CNID